MDREETIFCGSGKTKFDGDLIALNLCLSDLPEEFIRNYQGKRYISLDVCKKKAEDEYGKTHFIKVNQWTPDK